MSNNQVTAGEVVRWAVGRLWWMVKLFVFTLVCLMAYNSCTHSQERVYQRDKYGAIDYSKPSLEVKKDGTIVTRDKYGAVDHSKPSYQIKSNGTIVQKDKYGATDYSKPSGKVVKK